MLLAIIIAILFVVFRVFFFYFKVFSEVLFVFFEFFKIFPQKEIAKSITRDILRRNAEETPHKETPKEIAGINIQIVERVPKNVDRSLTRIPEGNAFRKFSD